MNAFLDSILYSYAQILFSNRRWLGAVLLAATFVQPTLGALGLTGVVLSNALAYILKFDVGRIRSGFYGFNGILFGAAFGYYYQLTPFLLTVFPVFLFMTFLIAAVLENHFATVFNLPGLSLPFVLSLYITIIFLRNYDWIAVSSVSHAGSASLLASLPESAHGYLHSLALIFFQPSVTAGALIALGMLLFSRVLFLLSIIGFAASAVFMHWLLPQRADELMILVGFNAILAAVALGGSLVIPSRKSVLLAILAVLMVVIFTGFFAQTVTTSRLPILVLPFNFVVLATIYSLKFRQKSSNLVLLYFQPGSPEENYYYHHSQQARFEKFKYFMPDLPVSGEWLISQGHNGEITHQADWRYAWDFVVTDEDGKTYANSGQELEDFHCFRLPVTAPLDGEVVLVVDSIPNNKIGDVNLAQNWGNTIILNHGEGFFSSFSHLESHTARVAKGDKVKRGEILALCGNSGRSPEPHLHFQFQATDQLGDKTLLYPFGFFLESNGGAPLLKISAYPAENTRVQNIVEHRAIKQAFHFPFDSTSEWEWTDERGRTHSETWTVRVDIYNAFYLQSSAGATLGFTRGEKVFYLTSFQGNRRSALYRFYLCAAQVPMTFLHDLTWHDTLPLSKVLRSPALYVSELLLPLQPQFSVDMEYHWRESVESGRSILLHSRLRISGRGLFKGFRDESEGVLEISADGELDTFHYHRRSRQVFSAKRTIKTTKEATKPHALAA